MHKRMVASSDRGFVGDGVINGKAKDGNGVKAVQLIIFGLSEVRVRLCLNVGRHGGEWVGV